MAEKELSRQRRYQIERKKLGLCPHCGKLPRINPETGKRYASCDYQRAYKNRKYRLKSARRRELRLLGPEVPVQATRQEKAS